MVRKPNVFEKILLLIGVAVLMIGYGFIHQQVRAEGVTLLTIETIFMWLVLVALIILIAVSENMKEELKQILALNAEEVRLLRQSMEKKK